MSCIIILSRHAASKSPSELRDACSKPEFNVAAMTDLLDGDNLEMRRNFRKFVSDPCMIPKYNVPLADEREMSLERMQRICDGGFISVLDFLYVVSLM